MTNPASPVPPSPVGSPAPGYPWPPAAMPAPEPKRSWFARHKILTGIGAFVAVGIVASALNGGGGAGESSAAASPAASPAAQSTAQSVASAAPQETAGQDAAPAPVPEQTTQADDSGKTDAGKTDSGLSFPGKQSGDVVGKAGDTIDDDGVKVTATTVAAGDATLGPTACSTITITNGSKNTLDVNALDFTLQNPAGAISNSGFLGSSNHLSSSTLIAGGSVSGDVCFDTDVSAGGQYVLLYKPTLSLFGHRRAWVNNL
ncbi:DUF4352 domain-containing protein [Actinomyces naeslundii]|nr:hypothetical protein BKH04_04700 [Actinomyces naeslundii]PKY95957.1 DUF4352 domain-containing protein [Actinomyces naeslundii]